MSTINIPSSRNYLGNTEFNSGLNTHATSVMGGLGQNKTKSVAHIKKLDETKINAIFKYKDKVQSNIKDI